MKSKDERVSNNNLTVPNVPTAPEEGKYKEPR